MIEIADAIARVLESPNESDRNHESANVVDGLFAIARAIEKLAHEVHIGNYPMDDGQ